MKIQIIDGLVNVLGGVQILKAKDARVRTDLLNDYTHLRGFARKAYETKQDIIDKFNADFRGADPNGDEYKKGFVALNEAVGAVLNGEVEVSLKAVALGDFMGVPGAEELTLEQVAFLIEWGVLKDE